MSTSSSPDIHFVREPLIREDCEQGTQWALFAGSGDKPALDRLKSSIEKWGGHFEADALDDDPLQYVIHFSAECSPQTRKIIQQLRTESIPPVSAMHDLLNATGEPIVHLHGQD